MKKNNSQELAKFLRLANKRTYANKDASEAPSTRLKSKDYHFEKGDLIYHDTYFGSRDFIGEEIVYKNSEPVWGMNYFGFILSKNINEEGLYDFLREALMQKYTDVIPVRGPKEYKIGEWLYTNSADGDLNRFTGIEKIYKAEVLLYNGRYHGGLVG